MTNQRKVDAESMLQNLEKSIPKWGPKSKKSRCRIDAPKTWKIDTKMKTKIHCSKNEPWGDLRPLLLRFLLFCSGANKSWNFGTSLEVQKNRKVGPRNLQAGGLLWNPGDFVEIWVPGRPRARPGTRYYKRLVGLGYKASLRDLTRPQARGLANWMMTPNAYLEG